MIFVNSKGCISNRFYRQ